MLIDSHCHLTDAAAAERAFAAGVCGMLNAGKDWDEAAEQLNMCAAFSRLRQTGNKAPLMWTSAGVHPDSAAQKLDKISAADLMKAADNPYVIAIGECGLDYHYGAAYKKEQKEMFARHIEASAKSGLPLMIHQREAEEDMLAMLTAGTAQFGRLRGVIHCFSSTADFAKSVLELGFYLSASGIVTFKSADEVAAVFQSAPAERLLIETDSPYLAPVPFRGRENEPAFIIKTAEKIAELRGLTFAETARITGENFFNLYQKARQENFLRGCGRV